MATSVKAVKESVEAGVDPEKSLKRKYDEYQEQQRVEDQKKEAERLQKEQEDQERQQMITMVHPYTGQQMQLTGEQRDQFFRDLATMKHTDFTSSVPVGTGSMGAGPTHIPVWGFPPGPPPTMGFGAMGTPATPTTPNNPQGYAPSFVAPATLPVITKPTSSWRWNERQCLRRYHTFDVCSDVGIVFLLPRVKFQQRVALAVLWFEKKGELWICVCFDMRVFDTWHLDLKYWKKVDSYLGEIDSWLLSFMLVAHSF